MIPRSDLGKIKRDYGGLVERAENYELSFNKRRIGYREAKTFLNEAVGYLSDGDDLYGRAENFLEDKNPFLAEVNTKRAVHCYEEAAKNFQLGAITCLKAGTGYEKKALAFLLNAYTCYRTSARVSKRIPEIFPESRTELEQITAEVAYETQTADFFELAAKIRKDYLAIRRELTRRRTCLIKVQRALHHLNVDLKSVLSNIF